MAETSKFTPEIIKSLLNDSINTAVAMHMEECGNDEKGFTRKRKLDMHTLIEFLIFIKGGSIQKELNDVGIKVRKSALSQRRKLLFWTDFENVFEDYNMRCKNIDIKTYKGYKLLAVDGTAINIARNPKSDSFIQSKNNPKGYNQIHGNMVYDVLNQTYLHCTIDRDEIGGLLFMLNWYDYDENTIFILDRGYESYNTMAHFIEKGLFFLIRVKQKNSAMREIRKLPMKAIDIDLSFCITNTQTNEDKSKKYIYVQKERKDQKRKRWDFYSPYPMTIRIVRILLDNGEYETLATNIPRDLISADEIKELYHKRWGIELGFRDLKYGVGLTNLHGKSEMFSQQEIFANMIFSNFCSRIINQVVLENNKERLHEYRVNRKMAIDICREFYTEKKISGEELLVEIAKYVEPVREGQKAERNLKAKSFPGFNYRIT